jgi:hypothetical protein
MVQVEQFLCDVKVHMIVWNCKGVMLDHVKKDNAV